MGTWSHLVHLALLHPQRPELLTVSEGNTSVLPSVRFEPNFLTDGGAGPKYIRETFGVDSVVLRQLHFHFDGDTQQLESLVLIELQEDPPSRPDLSWLGATEIATITMPKGALKEFGLSLLRQSQGEDAAPEIIPKQRLPWSRRGWALPAQDWMQEQLDRLERPTTGACQQVKHWGLSSVWRCPTVQGPVYFKAVPPLFSAESTITAALGRLFPEQVPTVLAADPERGWMLLEDFGGEFLRDVHPGRPNPHPLPGDETLQVEALRAYAQMQIESVPHVQALLAAGLADRRRDTFQAQLHRLLHHAEEIEHLTPDAQAQLPDLEPRLLATVDELYAFGLPETLVHGDLGFHNIVAVAGRPLYFDWALGGVAHPFMDLLHVVEFDPEADRQGPLLRSYLEPWEEWSSQPQLVAALDLALDLAFAFWAIVFQLIREIREPTDHLQEPGDHRHLGAGNRLLPETPAKAFQRVVIHSQLHQRRF